MIQQNSPGVVAFIGIGTMGREMALNLAKAGHRVVAYDVRPVAAESLAAHGVAVAATIADAVTQADVAILMLPDTPDVESVIYGPDGLLGNPPTGRLVIDMSTIAPGSARKIHVDLKNVGVDFLDAPVSGGPLGAKNAELSIMVGGARWLNTVFLKCLSIQYLGNRLSRSRGRCQNARITHVACLVYPGPG